MLVAARARRTWGGELKDSDDFHARLKCFLEKRLLKDLVKRS